MTFSGEFYEYLNSWEDGPPQIEKKSEVCDGPTVPSIAVRTAARGRSKRRCEKHITTRLSSKDLNHLLLYSSLKADESGRNTSLRSRFSSATAFEEHLLCNKLAREPICQCWWRKMSQSIPRILNENTF